MPELGPGTAVHTKSGERVIVEEWWGEHGVFVRKADGSNQWLELDELDLKA